MVPICPMWAAKKIRLRSNKLCVIPARLPLLLSRADVVGAEAALRCIELSRCGCAAARLCGASRKTRARSISNC